MVSRLVSVVLVLAALAPLAQAQDFPNRPIRVVVGPGPDIVARVLGPKMTEVLRQPVVVEQRPGAGGVIASQTVSTAAPDGYTLLQATASYTINTALQTSQFDLGRDFAPVGRVSTSPFVLVVHPSVPARTLSELIAYAKANPGKLNMASSGNGSTIHMSGELFKMLTGINMVHVPYRGGAPALTDLIAGQVHVMFDNIPTSAEHIKAGRLRGLAVTSAARSQVLPDLPTVADFLPGYEASAWYGLGAPKNTPDEVIDKINKGMNAVLADPKPQARFAELGASLLPGSPADFSRLVADETEKWGKVVRFSGAKPD